MSSQSCLHQNSAQNAPIEKFTALTETTFVTISVLISQGPKFDPDPKKSSSSQSCSHRNSVQNAPIDKFTALMGATFVTISMFMSRGHFPSTFAILLDNFWTTPGHLLDNFWTTFGQPLGNFWATKIGDKKCVRKSRP